MKKFTKILITLSFFSSILIAQEIEFNEEFLSSLPENIQSDFKNKSKQAKKENEFDYSNPDTRIKKLEFELEEADRILTQIRLDLNQNSNKNSKNLKRFGSNFFKTFQSSFSPINEPAIAGDYILDSGDQLTIQLVGQKNNTIEEFIRRDGALYLDEVGAINLAGLDIQQAKELISAKVNQSFAGVEVYISLSKLRAINVLIIGYAENPGMYTLSGGSSVLSLIHVAGGISDQGSYRNISVKRNNQIVQNIDLYDILINGNLPLTGQLRSGDVLVINQKLGDVRLSGGFSQPGIYEFKKEESLLSLLSMAGIKKSHTKTTLQIERLSKDLSKRILSIDINDAEQFKLFDGDSIELYGIQPEFTSAKRITISGEVNVPGTFTVEDNIRLSDAIEMAGGYTDQAYPLGGVFSRESAKRLENQSKNKGYDELLRYLVASPGFGQMSGGGNADGIITFLSLLKDYKPSGRIISEFELSELKKNSTLNRFIEDGDSVHIPSYTSDVYIFGEVIRPGPIPFDEMSSAMDYINAAGSFSRVADTDRVIIISPNGRSSLVSSSIFRMFHQDQILPGSVIYIPRQIGKVDGINLAATLSPIISSFALSIASLNSINN